MLLHIGATVFIMGYGGADRGVRWRAIYNHPPHRSHAPALLPLS